MFACEHHADQRRRSGEDFIVHPVGVAKICAGMRLDTETLCAALLHDTVEDTSASLDEVREAFGDDVAGLVDGVTKLTGITFQSRDEAQAENYRKMMVAMATDIRVILIKLADRLHNMRTLDAMAKQKQIEKAKETLEIYAPLAHRLGIHAIKWELEDLAFADAAPAQVRGDQGPRQPAARGARALRLARRRLPRQGAAGARHRRRDLRARQALLLDLLEDDPQGPRVQRDLRPHGDAGDRRLREGLLRGGGRHPLALEAAARALQGHGRDAPVQHVPGAPHDRDRARGPAAGDPDPHARDARDGGVRRRRALALQGGRPRQGAAERRPDRHEAQVAQVAARLAGRRGRPEAVHRAPARRADGGRGLRLHAQGRGQVARRRRHAARLRVRDPHRRRPPLRGRQGQRQDRAAALRAGVRRHRRDPHRQARARPVARLAGAGEDDARPQQDPRAGSRPSRATTPSTPAATCCRSTCPRPACRPSASPARRCSPT